MKQKSFFSIIISITLSFFTVFSALPLITQAADDDLNTNAVVFPNPFSNDQEPVSVDEQRAKQLAERDIVAFAQERFGQLVGTLFGFLGALSIIPIVVGGFQLMISQGGAYADKGKKTLYWGFVGLITGLFGYLVFGFLLNLLIQAP